MKIAVHINKITDDDEHPFPWKYFVQKDTPLGGYKDEGLCESQEKCLETAEARFRQWIADKKTYRRTSAVKTVELPDDLFD